MSYEVLEDETLRVEEAVRDLRDRTKGFALRIVKMSFNERQFRS